MSATEGATALNRGNVNQCLRQYKKSVDAYRFLEEQLRCLREVKEGRLRVEQRLVNAALALAVLGEGLAYLPEMALDLVEGERKLQIQSRHLDAAGIVVEYREVSEGPPGEEIP